MITKLRHGVSYLTPSEMASQFYCEYKVHLNRLHPQVVNEIPQLQIGTMGHAELTSEAVPVTKAEIDKRINQGQNLVICEKDLQAEFEGVQVTGRSDFFVVHRNRSLLIMDFKFTKSLRPYTDQIAQVQIYALLSELMGFIPDELVLGVVLLPPVVSDPEIAASSMGKLLEMQQQIKRGTLQIVCQACERARNTMLESNTDKIELTSEGARIFLNRYNSEQAKQFTKWAMEYWLGKREPLPVAKMPFDSWKKKCKSCQFNAAGLCEHALDTPSKEMVARLGALVSSKKPLPLVNQIEV